MSEFLIVFSEIENNYKTWTSNLEWIAWTSKGMQKFPEVCKICYSKDKQYE